MPEPIGVHPCQIEEVMIFFGRRPSNKPVRVSPCVSVAKIITATNPHRRSQTKTPKKQNSPSRRLQINLSV